MNKVPVEYYRHLEYFTQSWERRTHLVLKEHIVLCLYDAGFITQNTHLSGLTSAGENAMMKYNLLK
jgi:hypothetical protein